MVAKVPKIPESVIRRLPMYLRHLEQLRNRSITTISSQDLGAQLDSNPAQIRKDLAYFGEFGRKGIGYEVEYLIDKITQILRLDRELPVALVGVGHLGIALCHYNQNKPGNLKILYAFDRDLSKVDMMIGPVVVEHDSVLEKRIAEASVQVAIVAVPSDEAQSVVDRLVSCGIHAILNFAPISLRVPEHVQLRNADFTSELQSLAYYAAD